MLQKIKNYAKRHKIIAALVIIAIGWGAYIAYGAFTGTSTVTTYFAQAAKKGTITVSVSGTGQVSVSHQTDVKSKVSGDVVYVGVKNGQTVKAGTILAQFDSVSANNAVRDAQINLESAQLSLEKLQRGSLQSDIDSAQLKVDNAKTDLADAQTSLEDVKAKAVTDLASVYSDTRNILQDAYNKSDDILNRQIHDLFSTGPNPELTFLTTDSQGRNIVNASRVAVNDDLRNLKLVLDNFQTGTTTGFTASLKSESTYLTNLQNFLVNLSAATNAATGIAASTVNTYLSAVNSARSTINTELTTVNNQLDAVTNQETTNKDNINAASNKVDSAKSTLLELENSLQTLKDGADVLDVKSQQLSVKQRQNALNDAEANLSDYSARAPFDGTVAKITVQKGDSISSGTVVATLITTQRTAVISLNEVDAAKVVIGQKATLTFDAIDGLTIDGVVADLDTLGTVSQGVVTYNSQIVFDTQDARIKPGMSVTATITTQEKADVIAVPNAAVKTTGNRHFVQISNAVSSTATPKRQQVEIGLENDTLTEITSGVNEGDFVVVRTINAAATAPRPTGSSSSSFRLPGIGGGGGGGGGNFR